MATAPLDANRLERAELQAALRMAFLRINQLEHENNRLTNQLRNLADHDPLTDLLKPVAFADAVEAHLALGARGRAGTSLVVLDLDGFSDLLESQGAKAADDALVTVADHLRERLEEADVVARLGPDRFAALLATVDPACCLALIDDLLAEVRSLLQAPDGRFQVTISAGLTDIRDGDSAAVLFDRAIAALAAARAAGGDRVVDARPARVDG